MLPNDMLPNGKRAWTTYADRWVLAQLGGCSRRRADDGGMVMVRTFRADHCRARTTTRAKTSAHRPVSSRLDGCLTLPVNLAIAAPTVAMAGRELCTGLSGAVLRNVRSTRTGIAAISHRNASSSSSLDANDNVDPASSLTVPAPSDDIVRSFDPIGRSRARVKELPPSRYVILILYCWPS